MLTSMSKETTYLSEQMPFGLVVMDFQNMTHEEWEVQRREHYGLDHFTIGGSDAGTIMQVNKYKDLPQLYMEKLGEVDIPVENESVRMGHKLEPIIRECFAEDHPEYDVHEWKALIQHPERPWQVANTDGVYYNHEHGRWELLEIKNISSRVEPDWKDGPPDYYYCQFQHYLDTLGLEAGHFAVKFDSNKVRYFYVVKNQAFVNNLIFQEEMFIQRLENEMPPEITGSDSSTLLVNHLYPNGGHEVEKEKRGGGTKTEKEVLELDEEYGQLVEQRQSLFDELKRLTEEKDALDNKIKMKLGEYQKGYYSNGNTAFNVSWGNRAGKKFFNAGKLKEKNPELYEKFLQKFDEKAFKAEHPDLFKEFQEEGKGSRTFLISEKGVG